MMDSTGKGSPRTRVMEFCKAHSFRKIKEKNSGNVNSSEHHSRRVFNIFKRKKAASASSSSPVDQAPQLEIGQYILGKNLGVGAHGKVKLATHAVTGHEVAIKILNKNKIRELSLEEKLRREISILQSCTHPHIIRLYEVIDTPTDIFLVNEYVSGGELFDRVVLSGRLPNNEAREFFHEIISGVEYCHFQKIAHRDIKPENLLLDSNQKIKIADFGLSNVIRDGDFMSTPCGTAHYCAPEVMTGKLYAGPEADVWSCGVTLYVLLCGSLPFDDENATFLFRKIKSGTYRLPSYLTEQARDLIQRMLEVDPMKRITVPEIRLHPWFQHKLPPYLSHTPEEMEQQESIIDQHVINEVLNLPFHLALGYSIDHSAESGQQQPIVTRELVEAAASLEPSCINDAPKVMRDLHVAYELIFHHEYARLHAEEVAKAIREGKATPPAISCCGSRNSIDDFDSDTDLKNEPFSIRSISGIQVNMQFGEGRRWHVGMKSKKDPVQVMCEVYSSLMALECDWMKLSSYKIRCRWRPREQYECSEHANHMRIFCEKTGQIIPLSNLCSPDYSVEIDLTLYSVEDYVYLLDFQKMTGDASSFMSLCANIITELRLDPKSKRRASMENL